MTRRGQEPIELLGRRVLVMGLGTRQGGAGVARYLAGQGAEVTVTDLRAESDLEPALLALSGLPIRYTLGEHRVEDFEAAELVVRNPAVPRNSPWLERARERGIPIEMEMSLFFRACSARVIGITGTKGKTTTATLCARILKQHHPGTVLAGNMGTSALDQLDRIGGDTPVVIELSSWQLEGLAEYRISPDIAVLTNVSEDHLNRYDSYGDYINAKRHITRFQMSGDWFVANRNDPVVWSIRDITEAGVVPFGWLSDGEDGAAIEGGELLWRWEGERYMIMPAARLPLPGGHTVHNALAASAAALIAGASIDDVRSGLESAEPVPHRQELVATIEGVDYINDTTATAPAAAIAALNTFESRSIVLIAGGASKGASLREFANTAARLADAVVLLDGDETARLQSLLASSGVERLSEPMRSMGSAVQQAREWSRPGGVVLLSPACASFGLFKDEFDRGEQFREAVRNLARTKSRGAR